MTTLLGLMRSKLAFAPYLIIALLIGAVVFRSTQLTSTRAQLEVEQTFRTEISDILHAPNDRPETVRAAARAVIQTNNNQRTTLQTIDREVVQNRQRADAADAALVREQAQNRKAFQSAQPKIRELEQRQPTGDPVIDQSLIEADSMAPWQGWTQ